MSSTPSGFNDFYQLIQTHITSYSKDIHALGNKNVERYADHYFNDVIKKFAEIQKLSSDQALFKRELEQLPADSNEKINAVINIIFEFREIDEETQEYFAKAGQQLIDEILDLKHFLDHFKEIEKKGFQSQLKFNWAKNVLKKLFESENAWAIETVKQIIDREDEAAFELLIILKSEQDLDDPLLSKYAEHPGLEKKLRMLLEMGDPEYQERAYQLINNLCQNDYEWAKKLLQEKLKETHPQKLALEVISDLLGSNSLDWVLDYVLQELRDSVSWAVNLVFDYISDEDRQFPDKLIEKLLTIAQNDLEVEHIVTAYAIILSPKHQFYLKFLEVFNHESFSYLKNRLERMQKIQRSLAIATSPLPSFREEYCWKNSPIAYKIGAIRLLIRREENLIRILTKKTQVSQFQKSPVLKCFPKASSLLMGCALDFVSLTSTVAKVLESHRIPVFFPHQTRSPHKVDHANAYPFESKFDIEIWLQDSSSMHEGEIRVPNLVLQYTKTMQSVVKSRDQRLKTLYSDSFQPAKFGMLGGVAKNFEQFSMLEPLFNRDPSLRTLSIQFTYNEGGNVLIGEKKGLRYAIIGKDAVTTSEIILKRELAQIGLQKNQRGEWVLGDSYLMDDCRLDLDDLQLLFACDYGLASAEQVYFVEQPDYHLDTSMTIVAENTILLNSSTMAYKQMETDLTNWMEKQGANIETERSVYYKRLETAQQMAIIEQKYEDAAAADLESFGFEVIRVGGKFYDLTMPNPENHQVNFFNFLSLTTPAEKRVVIALGCNEPFQKQFVEIIQKNVRQVSEIHFLPQSDSEKLLKGKGGIHCVTKVCSDQFL